MFCDRVESGWGGKAGDTIWDVLEFGPRET